MVVRNKPYSMPSRILCQVFQLGFVRNLVGDASLLEGFEGKGMGWQWLGFSALSSSLLFIPPALQSVCAHPLFFSHSHFILCLIWSYLTPLLLVVTAAFVFLFSVPEGGKVQPHWSLFT